MNTFVFIKIIGIENFIKVSPFDDKSHKHL